MVRRVVQVIVAAWLEDHKGHFVSPGWGKLANNWTKLQTCLYTAWAKPDRQISRIVANVSMLFNIYVSTVVDNPWHYVAKVELAYSLHTSAYYTLAYSLHTFLIETYIELGSRTLAWMDFWPKTYFRYSNLTSTLILTLKHKNVFGKTKWRHFSGKCLVCKLNRPFYNLIQVKVPP